MAHSLPHDAVFDYPKGQFTVTEVDSETFRECYLQGNTVHEWTSGHDVVPLENPGRRWFFSSLANHCDLGLKLFVSVAGGSASGAPAPAPEHHQPPNPAPSPVNVRPMSPAPTAVSPAPTPEAPPSPDKSSAGLNCYKIGEAVARAAVVAGAFVAAVFV
ncbi:early nodulin-20-like [Panicum hallii]|jgi:hypothetical protein|uniref:early nodulin-20-like n=1 Tax=Panicum hallii TaxID=206008 RepID=UPI000DF4DC62|nr:early nodulin-20-like [Panicum hallii]